MSRQRKYRKGKVIRSLSALAKEFSSSNYIFHMHKPLHRAWWGSWSLHYASLQVRAGRLFYALQVKEAKP